MIKNVFNYQSNRQIVLNSIIVKNIDPKIQKEICE